jgi:hypothetical protein
MTQTRGIDYMTRSHPLFRLAGSASRHVRRTQYEWFRNAVGGVGGKLILDHGSTPDTVSADSNCFIEWLLADGATVYSTSPEDISHLPSVFPELRVLPWGERLNGLADLAISSSVVQHVGNREAQRTYVAGVMSLGRQLLLTTPDRRHWLEFHTKLPVLHWLPKERHRAALSALGMPFWANEANLNLLTRAELQHLIEQGAASNGITIDVRWYRPRFLGQVSHLVALVARRA